MDRIYYIKPVDNSRWTPAPNSRERRFHAAFLFAAALLVGAGLLFAGERYKSREYGYQIEQLEREKAALLEAGRKLQLEQASLADPLRIDTIARNELGMTTLAPQQIYRDRPVVLNGAVLARQNLGESAPAPQSRSVAAALP